MPPKKPTGTRKAQSVIRSLAEAEAKRLMGERWLEAEEPAKKVLSADNNMRLVKRGQDINAAREEAELTAHQYRTNPISGPELYKFGREVLGYNLIAPQPHDEMCDFLAALTPNPLFNSDQRLYGMMLVPRDCFKSTVGVVCLSLYLLVKNPNLCILIDAFRHDVSQLRLKAIKWHIENNRRFRMLFGDWKPQFREDTWNENSINIAPRNRDGTTIMIDPTIDTCGVDRPKVGSHPHLILVDDVHNRENVQTPGVRNKVWEHLGGMTPMLQPGGTMLIYGTRWSHHDCYGKIIREDKDAIDKAARAGEIHPLQAARYRKLIRGAKDSLGNLYFPSRLTEKYLDDAKKTPGMTEYLFRSQYYNETVESAQNMFPQLEEAIFDLDEFYHDIDSRNSIVRCGDDEVPVLTTLAWDTAGHNPTKESDFHGLTVVGCDPLQRWIVLEGIALKDTPNNVVDQVVGLIVYYRPHTVSIEVVGQSGVWITLLRNALITRGIYMPYIVENKPPSNMNKLTRIDTILEPLYKDNKIAIASTCVDLIHTMEEYPQVDHFDTVDSLAQHFNIVRPADANDGVSLYDYEYDELTKKQSDPRARWGAYAGRSSTPRRNFALRIAK